MKYIILFLLQLIFSLALIAQTWQELHNESYKLYKNGEYDKALLIAEKAVEHAKTEMGDSSTHYISSINRLGDIYHDMGRYDKAEPLYIEVIALKKKVMGENDVSYGNSLSLLGMLYDETGRYTKAESLYILALEVRRKGSKLDRKITVSLNNLGELYRKMGQYDKAEPLLFEAMERVKVETGVTRMDYATILNNLALVYAGNKKFDKAQEAYKEVLEITKTEVGENHLDYAISLNNLAELFRKTKEYKKAEKLYILANAIGKQKLGENHRDYATWVFNLGVLYFNMGSYEKAEPLLVKAEQLRKTILGVEHPDYAKSLQDLATLYLTIGLYEKAEPLFLRSAEIREKIYGKADPEYAYVLNTMAALYHNMNNFSQAELFYLEAIKIFKDTWGSTHYSYISAFSNLALLYQGLGQYEKAEPIFIEVMETRKRILGDTDPTYALSLGNLGALYSGMGYYEKALPLYLESLAIGKTALGENNQDYALLLNNLGVLYSRLGLHKKAEPIFIQSLSLRKKILGENHKDYAESLNNLAVTYKNMSEYKKAEPLYTQSMLTWKKSLGENHPDYATSLNNLAAFYMVLGEYEKAEPLILQNSKITLENLIKIFPILSEKEKGSYLTNKVSLIEANNSFLYKYKKAAPAVFKNNFNLGVLFKSLTLTDTREVFLQVRQSRDTMIQRLFQDWQMNKSILAKQYSLPVVSRRDDLSQLESVTETIEKELSRKSTEFRIQQNTFSISLSDVQKNLTQDEVAIEFMRFRLFTKEWTDSTIYAAYILNKKDSAPIFVPLCEEKQLQQLFDSVGNTATSMVSKFYRGLEVKNKNANTLGKELYKLIWQPLEPYLKGVKKISYSPAGKLYSIAFHALTVDSTTVLMDKYQLKQYTSTRQVALRNSENQTVKPENITLFGNASFTMDSLQLAKQKMNQPEKENVSTSIYTPQKRSNDNGTWDSLPGTAEEVKKIKQLFDQNKITTKSFVQTTASEENLKALDGNSPQILHIATHGFFLPEADKKRKENNLSTENTYTLADDPLLRSGLILAAGNYTWSGKTPIDGVEDGIATAYEISQLNLSNTELVVLSACETALGDVKGSEGVFGLQRAFKMAGVKKMIVSLWQVPDKETAELMTNFYSYWMKGKTIEESFTQAQAGMRKKYSPFYWAAFVLVE